MNTTTILIADDEPDIIEILDIYLKNEGYCTITAANGNKALAILDDPAICVDLAILDVMMPELDGIATCIKIRKQCNIPIIILSAKSHDMDKIMGLSAGADDYLAKPFNPVELVARVKAQLRRFYQLNPSHQACDQLNYNDLTLLLNEHKVLKNNEVIVLTRYEFSILELLWKNKGIVFSTDHIYERIWENENYEVDNTVMVHIKNLRKKIEDDPRNPQYIKTVWGVGYKFS